MIVDMDTGNATLVVDGTSAQFNIGRLHFEISRLEFETGWAYTGPHNKLYVDAVPEPSCLLLLGIALLTGGTVLHRREGVPTEEKGSGLFVFFSGSDAWATASSSARTKTPRSRTKRVRGLKFLSVSLLHF